MAFNSFGFFIFFPLVAVIYFTLPIRYRRLFLLAAGYYFYLCFTPRYLILLIASTFIDYYLGPAIGASTTQAKRKRWLMLGLIHNIGLLASLKYLNFILPGIKGLELIVPVGLSYYTFKKISYLVDVYRGSQEPVKSAVDFALYVSFFPSIMAGPIDRAHRLVPQIQRVPGFDYQRAADGLKRMAWGFFKKLVIADRLAVFVGEVYNDPGRFEGLSLIMATVYFSFQVYCDFSGYTDIAVGAGKVLGFELTENFDRPYFSQSITEFWKRWHISFSSWLMDYLFLPIAYAVSRKIKQPRLLNVKAETWAYLSGILTTMILCGLWHGASWTFVLWGAIHGLFLAVSFATKKIRRKIRKKLGLKKRSPVSIIMRTVITFSIVTFAWIFFRAGSLSDALYIVSHLFSGWSEVLSLSGLVRALTFGLLKKELAVAAVSVFIMLAVHLPRKKDRTF
jgi:D-alanyl-lipoteichoic acid acyltransferase DltB (MBOAT superfamily)